MQSKVILSAFLLTTVVLPVSAKNGMRHLGTVISSDHEIAWSRCAEVALSRGYQDYAYVERPNANSNTWQCYAKRGYKK